MPQVAWGTALEALRPGNPLGPGHTGPLLTLLEASPEQKQLVLVALGIGLKVGYRFYFIYYQHFEKDDL